MRLTLDPTPDPAIRARLFAMIDRYNDDATDRREEVRHLSIVLRDGAGAVEGGLVGISYYDWLIVEMLFVPVGRREQGVGARLMRAAEAVAARRGCRGVWLDTGSPAARGFYARIGYDVFATLPDYPRGHEKWWLARTAPQDSDTAGLEIGEARDPALSRVVGRALTAVADELFGPEAGRENLAVVAEEDGAWRGGLWMVARRDWLFLDLFVLDEAARKQGLGGRILAMAEAEARARGCVGVWLDTYGFQARPFYERHGYAVFGALADYPAPHGRFFLAKRFQDDAA
jgi:GNAT superfamily N-acetyltransferase